MMSASGEVSGLALAIVCMAVAVGVLGAGAGWLARQWALRLVGGEVRQARWLGPVVCAVAWALLVAMRGASLQTLFLCLACVPLVACSLTDLQAYVIPNACVAAAVALHACFLLLLSVQDPGLAAATLVRSLVGAGAALVPLLVLTLVMDRVLGRESMGGGDLKLLAVCGLYVGWQQLLLLLPLACLGGIASSVILTPKGSGTLAPFPFGPSIAVALWVTFLVGPHVEAWLSAWVF